jgi:serine/threonine-protein kinase
VQLAWLADYQAGECVFLSPQPGTGVPLAIEGFGTTVAPFATLLTSYAQAHGAEPNIDVRVINPPQCPVVDYMNQLKTATALPVTLALSNTSAVLKSGEAVAGRIEGLGGRAVSLFLVNGVGGATNLKPWITQGSDGSVGFSFTVNLAAGADPAPQLILAVVTDQPVTKLDAVPNGVTARALVPFMKNEIGKARQEPVAALRFFKVEN